MLLSAVSLSFLMALGLGQVQQQTLPPNEGGAWEKISKSLVLIERGGKPMGYAVLIDPSGLFLTHSSAIGAGMVSAKTRSGQPVSLITLTIDEPTQLVLLQAQIWSDKEATAISVETGKGLKGKQLLAALPSGPIPGTLVANDRNGVMRPSLRYVPLSEIRFETPNDRVGGSPVFTLDGKLVGLLNATLEPMGAHLRLRSVMMACRIPATQVPRGSPSRTRSTGTYSSGSWMGSVLRTERRLILPSGPSSAMLSVKEQPFRPFCRIHPRRKPICDQAMSYWLWTTCQ